MTIGLKIAAISFAIAWATSGCAHSAPPPAFNVKVRGPANACYFEVKGRVVTIDELLKIGREEAAKTRRAHIDADVSETPYRCLGTVIYTLQTAGFKQVGYISEPPEK
jgi:hypothetical protein